MGQDVTQTEYTPADRRRFRGKVHEGLDAFERMLAAGAFDEDRAVTGMEIELNLTDEKGDPSFHNAEVLQAIADPDFQTELGQYNIELNAPPRPLPGEAGLERERELRRSLNAADAKARGVGSQITMIGILPTVMPEDFEAGWMSSNTRYTALNDSIFIARGEEIELDIEGPTGERIHRHIDSIAPESACTSVQLHLQVAPQGFAPAWNAAQAIAAPQVALAANSPFFFGKRLHDETRIALFQQSTDTRPVELKNQGVRPRVHFGEGWINSIFDLFEENVRLYPALLAELDDENPLEVLEAGGVPTLNEFNLHNGTIYRWNRPVYDVADGKPHLRVENRVLPAGPTVIDVMANAAFYYGLVRSLSKSERPVWSRFSFSAAEENFNQCAERGLDARVYWPGFGELGVDELTLRHLLPLAQEGLEDWQVPGKVIDRYLSIIEGRCLARVNGAVWQTESVRRFEAHGASRDDALHSMLERYMEHMHANLPVHTWPMPA